MRLACLALPFLVAACTARGAELPTLETPAEVAEAAPLRFAAAEPTIPAETFPRAAWQGLETAADAPVIAAWSATELLIVHQYATPQRVDMRSSLLDVAVDPDGIVYALRVVQTEDGPSTLELDRFADGAHATLPLEFGADGEATPAVVATRDRVVVVAHSSDTEDEWPDPVLATSLDHGETWSTSDLPELGNAPIELAATRTGVQMMTGWEAGCGGGGQDRFYASTDRGVVRRVSWSLDMPFTQRLGHAGWAYGIGWCDDGECLMSEGAGDPIRVLALDEMAGVFSVSTNGESTVALIDDRLYALEGPTARPLGVLAHPEYTAAVAVDHAGRVVAIDTHGLRRLESDGSWRTVAS